MGIRYTLSYCPKCKRRVNSYGSTDLKSLVNDIKGNHRTLAVCPYCGAIYRTGFVLKESKTLQEKMDYLERIKYENQTMKDMEFGFYGLNTIVDFESEKWVYKLYKCLAEDKREDILNSLIRKKIILYSGDKIQIEDLKNEEAKIIEKNKSKILEYIGSIGVKGINDIKLIKNYTSYEEVRKINEKVSDNSMEQALNRAYREMFKDKEEQAYGLIRAIKRILSLNIPADEIIYTYLLVTAKCIGKNKSIDESAKLLKEVYSFTTIDNITEILALILFFNDNPSRDVNTVESRVEIKTKYIKEVYKKIENIQEYNKMPIARKNTENMANEKSEKKFCTNCGRVIEREWKFCNYCGNKLD